ncbi:crossover junction endodeoxyribonuclease RuvC [uncultured Fusobacterium sp.]|uniref:crossover junction endodeoxyribonuclease RuvC n=1 Tax=uncultured Fusobacterium sp. TaxID=159267 RepID=UPI0025967FEC|nr:crossover junction endodeoxyribonuclease RuvC [uncultured Fusobacterium sp.]
MGKKINPEEYVGQEFVNKIGEKYKVLKYLFKEKLNYCFDIQFIGTGNLQMATLNQIRNNTCFDLIERKKLKRMKTELQLRERTRLVNKAKHTCVIPNNLKEKNVLAVDLSTTSTGIAYSRNGVIVRWKTIKSDYIDFRERGLEIVKQLVEILEKGMIDTVILEDVYLGLNSDVLTKLSEVRGMLTYHIKKLNLELLLVPAVLWKHRIEGVPTHRQEQKEFMMKKFFEYTGVEADSDDSADAYMMLRACLGGK